MSPDATRPRSSIADLLAIDRALRGMADLDPPLYELLEMTSFTGMTIAEVAELRGVSTRTVDRDLIKARALLRRSLVIGGFWPGRISIRIEDGNAAGVVCVRARTGRPRPEADTRREQEQSFLQIGVERFARHPGVLTIAFQARVVCSRWRPYAEGLVNRRVGHRGRSKLAGARRSRPLP